MVWYGDLGYGRTVTVAGTNGSIGKTTNLDLGHKNAPFGSQAYTSTGDKYRPYNRRQVQTLQKSKTSTCSIHNIQGQVLQYESMRRV